jgi:DNA-binding CsgD family transcriptional regulator
MGAGWGHELGQIAEMALACEDSRSLHEQMLDVLERAVGFDKGSLSTCAGTSSTTCARGYDRSAAFERLDHYMNELTPQEISAALQHKPIVDIEVLTARRRDRLSLYHQLLRPEKVTVFATVMWRGEHGMSGLTLARTGPGSGFTAAELRTLEWLLPSIRLADAYVGLRVNGSPGAPCEEWTGNVGLTTRERQVAELVIRGLANREIAALLGVSPNTVRNQLASVFRKANVSNRAELVFVASARVSSRPRAIEQPRWISSVR